MKTLKQIIKQTPVFLNNWKEAIDVIADFEDVFMTGEEYRATKCPYQNAEYWEEKKRDLDAALKKHDGEHILFASYGSEGYEGDAWVLFERDGKLYEVNGGHCSCYGLEGQWEPEVVMLEAIQKRLIDGNMGRDSYSGNEFADELMTFLGVEAKIHGREARQ